MGKVYNHMRMIGSRLEDPEFAPELTAQQRTAISKIHEDRWQYMHNHYHAAGYALDPEFSRENVFSDGTLP